MTINILGDAWEISVLPPEQDERLENMGGYTDWTTRKIVVADVKPDKDSVQDMAAYKRKVMRHEIIHAFIFAAGLAENSLSVDSWAQNEEMVDFFAFHGQKIYAAWKEADCLG